MSIQKYTDHINKELKSDNATEHTFCGDLQQLIENSISQYPIDEDNVVTKIKFALEPLHSPPLEGCLQGGLVNTSVALSDSKPLTEGKFTMKPNKQNKIITINNIIIQTTPIIELPYSPKLKPLLKDKRKAGMLSEVLFWQQVHKGKFYTIDFDRQRIIGNYIVDFYVKSLGLVIEIDGSSHDNKKEYDTRRQQFLENLGLSVYRITDADMKKNIGHVMLELENYIIEQYGVGVNKPPRPAGTPPKEGNFSQAVNQENFSQDVDSKGVNKK